MLALDFDAISLALAWLLAGGLVWMWRDPQSITDAVLRGWVCRHNRLPPRGVIIAAHILAILLWPRVVDRALTTGQRP